MAVVNPTVFQVVGYQNSGKTSFIIKLIEILTQQDIKTVTIKHHGHGGKPDALQGKDSVQHISAGAAVSIVEGEGNLILQANRPDWSLDDQIMLMGYFQPDIILIEGHKMERYPKVVIIRREHDLSLLQKVKNTKMVIVWNKELEEMGRKILDVPFFQIQDETVVWKLSQYLKQLVFNQNIQ